MRLELIFRAVYCTVELDVKHYDVGKTVSQFERGLGLISLDSPTQ